MSGKDVKRELVKVIQDVIRPNDPTISIAMWSCGDIADAILKRFCVVRGHDGPAES